MKKTASILLVIMLIISAIPFGAAAASGNHSEAFFGYTLQDGEASIIRINGNLQGDVEIPSSLGGYPVTEISFNAFSGQTQITSISIPESVEEIQNSAFEGCVALKSVSLPDNLKEINSSAFYRCTALESISLPDGIQRIGGSAFRGCAALKSISIPDGIETIREFTFAECTALESISIPDSVETIREEAFADCRALESISLPDSVKEIESTAFYNTKYYNKSSNWQNGVLYIGNYLITAKGELQGICELKPETKNIAMGAFRYSRFEEIIISNGIEKIPAQAFSSSTYLERITLSSSVVIIEESAFEGCTKLSSIIIPDSVKVIEEYAFKECWSLREVKLPNSLEAIADFAFNGCRSLENVTIPNSVKSIGYAAFAGCISLETIVIPDSVKKIGGYEFFGCEKLKEIKLPKNLEVISSGMFSRCINLKKIKLPEGLKAINKEAFSECKALESISIPKGTEKIGDSVFYLCESLKKITFPDSIESVGSGIVIGTAYCDNLSNRDGKFLYIGKCLVYADSSFKGAYTIKAGTKVVADSVFVFHRQITEIACPKSVVYIGNNAFARCYNLTKATLPESVNYIGDGAFLDCLELKKITLPTTVDYFGEGVLKGCVALEKAVIPSGAETLHYELHECRALKSVTLPKSVKKVEYISFYNCQSLTDVWYEGSKADRKKINFSGDDYEALTKAKWHYNTCYHSYKTTLKKATLTKSGSLKRVCKKCKYTDKSTVYYPKKIKLSSSKYTYNGKTKKPAVRIYDSKGKKLIYGEDYTYSRPSASKKVGTYKIKVTFKGNYSGRKYLYYKINPPKTSLRKLTAAKKSIKVSITKKTSQVSGYEIQYSTSKSFKNAKIKTIKRYKTTSATLKGLKAKKTYFVRVRTYKTVSGKKYYSAWSSYKYKKTK